MKIINTPKHFPSFCFCILCFLTFQTQAQDENAVWMLQDLLSDSTAIGEINSFQPNLFMHNLYYPNDISWHLKSSAPRDIIVKTKQGLFVLIDGTGRVYQVQKQENEIDFVRIDSTYYTGYNFGAYGFAIHDTLFSLGGYGFWRHNGHLRYFKGAQKGWEITALNIEVPILDVGGGTGYKPGFWNNPDAGKIYYVEKILAKNWLKQEKRNNLFYPDTAKVWQLNLNTKDWKLSGTIKNDAKTLMIRSSRLMSMPWGEVIQTGAIPEQTIYLFNYETNRISILGKAKASQITNLMFTEHNEDSKRKLYMIYFKDSTLHLVTSAKEHLKLTLKPSDFTLTGLSIYEPIKEKSVWSNISWLSLITFSIGMVLSIGAVFLVLRSKRSDQHNSIPEKTIFSATEIELIKAVFAKPDHAMAAEEMNYVLGTSKKSVDVQKKHRSEILRSINKKYSSLCGDAEPLLVPNKLDSDKRLVQYVVNAERYKKLNGLVDTKMV